MAEFFPLIYGLPSLLDHLMDREGQAPHPALDNGNRCYPPLQVVEDENAVYVRAAIAGASLDDVDLVLDKNSLVLCGAVPAPEGRTIRRERPTGPFKREVRLPCSVDASSIRAVMRNGLLSVTLPKDPRAKKRAIPVACSRGSGS